jgi:FkbM family methyltransferase
VITSYAQNLEDVVLFRAFENLKTGFYIDIGANDPVTDSVTKYFYESGWRGVNIEPAKHWYEKVKQDRPRDICLNIAVSDEIGSATFYEIESSGLSTLIDDVARRHDNIGFAQTSYEVRTETLATVCERYAEQTIHFLKIDVEGAEEKVIRGADFKRFRPWVVLVEATEPMSSKPSHFEWDPILVAADYEFVLFDGLNRFYVAKERPDLKHFAVKGDRYQTADNIWTIGHWRRIAGEREIEISTLQAEKMKLHSEISQIKASRFWKTREAILAPFRKGTR